MIDSLILLQKYSGTYLERGFLNPVWPLSGDSWLSCNNPSRSSPSESQSLL